MIGYTQLTNELSSTAAARRLATLTGLLYAALIGLAIAGTLLGTHRSSSFDSTLSASALN